MASVCSLFGVLAIAMPIPIIVNNFAEYYKEEIRKENSLKQKAEFLKAKRNGTYNEEHLELNRLSSLTSTNINGSRLDGSVYKQKNKSK